MEVTATITRADLLRVMMHMLFRARANWVFVGVIAVAALGVILFTRPPRTLSDFGFALAASILGGLGGLIFGMAFQFVYTLLVLGKSGGGVLGDHTYAISESGLRERTSTNDGMQYWKGVTSIRKIGGYLLFQVGPHLFYIVPKRAFGSAAAFDAFSQAAHEHWMAA